MKETMTDTKVKDDYSPLKKTIALLGEAERAVGKILKDRLLLDMDDRDILGNAEFMLRRHIAKPDRKLLRELRGTKIKKEGER